MSTHIIVERDTRALTYHAMGEVYEECHVDAAETLRGVLHADLLRGGNLGPDTGTLAESLFVQTREGSDYDERLGAARDAYTGNQSYWRQIVREIVSQDAYSDADFDEKAMAEEELPRDAFSAVATFMAYGFWWQMGHYNVLTENWERRSWFIEPVAQWAQANMERAFDDFEARVARRMGK